MKSFLFSLLLSCVFSTVFSQDFGLLNEEWVYDHDGGTSDGVTLVQYDRDTIVNNRVVRVFTKKLIRQINNEIREFEASPLFIYEENGVEIINTLTNPSTSQGSDDIYHIKMFSIKEPTVIAGFFEDPVRSKWTTYSLYLRYSLSLTANGQPQLQWVVTIRDFYNPDGDVDAEQASRVPKFLTLTKI